jgi:hypothetical protein
MALYFPLHVESTRDDIPNEHVGARPKPDRRHGMLQTVRGTSEPPSWVTPRMRPASHEILDRVAPRPLGERPTGATGATTTPGWCPECGARPAEHLARTHRADYYRCTFCGHVWAEDRLPGPPPWADRRRRQPDAHVG